MKAGRRLDALVAEKVLGWKRFAAVRYGESVVALVSHQQVLYSAYTRSQSDPGMWQETDAPTTKDGLRCVPPYSTEIDATWKVVESPACEGGHKFQLVQEHGLWTAVISGMGEADADTAPLAICLAALKAVGVEVPA